jgi:hypothetical protein
MIKRLAQDQLPLIPKLKFEDEYQNFLESSPSRLGLSKSPKSSQYCNSDSFKLLSSKSVKNESPTGQDTSTGNNTTDSHFRGNNVERKNPSISKKLKSPKISLKKGKCNRFI